MQPTRTLPKTHALLCKEYMHLLATKEAIISQNIVSLAIFIYLSMKVFIADYTLLIVERTI